jgi:ADP-ribose pyrophosphatase YjhB (NUDIX family)
MHLPENTIIASGPVIIENGKVLLNRSFTKDGQERALFMFPGGKIEDFDAPLEETAKREALEELGIHITILRPLQTCIAKRIDQDGYAILVHYLATRTGNISAGEDTVEWQWFDIHNLPKNITPNVREVIHAYLNETV